MSNVRLNCVYSDSDSGYITYFSLLTFGTQAACQ